MCVEPIEAIASLHTAALRPLATNDAIFPLRTDAEVVCRVVAGHDIDRMKYGQTTFAFAGP